MNEQASLLAQRVASPRGGPKRVSRFWLFHSAVGADLNPLIAQYQLALAELGWTDIGQCLPQSHGGPVDPVEDWNGAASDHGSEHETTKLWAKNQFGIRTSGSPRAYLVSTGSSRLESSKLRGTPAIIFVLDNTPTGLLHTYRQIKGLVSQRPELHDRLGVLSAHGGGTQGTRLVSTCRRHLGVHLINLGCLPRGEAKDWPNQRDTGMVHRAEGTATEWNALALRCLYRL